MFFQLDDAVDLTEHGISNLDIALSRRLPDSKIRLVAETIHDS